MSVNICAFRDIMCGKLFCSQGNANPNYGRLVQFSDCKAIFYSDRDNDFGQVDTGTKCGDKKVTIEKSQMYGSTLEDTPQPNMTEFDTLPCGKLKYNYLRIYAFLIFPW